MNKTIGIVILNYKTYSDTIRLTNDLLKFGIKDHFHIVIVDNESPNESFDELNKAFSDNPYVDVVASGENGGYAKGNNIGLRFLERYSPDYALILNNDVWFDESTIIKCIEQYETLENVGIVSPMQLNPDKEIAYMGTLRCNTIFDDIISQSILLTKLRGKRKYESNTDNPSLMMVDIIPGCFILINFQLFKDINYFDEDTFLFCEERFLFRKLNDRGYKNYLLLNEGYVHDHSLTINKEADAIRQKKMFTDGQIAFAKKYRRFPSLCAALLKAAFHLGCLESHLINTLKKKKQ
ncbi:MAG: glycosyltransferase family 2 protein [Paramuribaculum sp.]|nr:glycosyltransferase family 2 protein [Paramuribaculum sp.]